MRKSFSTGNRVCLIILALALAGFFLGLNNLANARAALRERNEIHVLDTLGGIISNDLYLGKPLPTDWLTFSNSADFSSSRHWLYQEENYTILAQPVTNPWSEGGVFFMVRSQPCKGPGAQLGRWTLVAHPKPLPSYISGGDASNRIVRVWVPEDSLLPAIRSQLARQP